MPSQKPRIALTVPDHINEILTVLHDLTGTPKTKLIIDILEQCVPVFSEHIHALEKIKADKENSQILAKNHINKIIVDNTEKLGDLAKEAKKL